MRPLPILFQRRAGDMHQDWPAENGMEVETAQVRNVLGLVARHEREFRVWSHKWGRVQFVLDTWYPDVFEGRSSGPDPLVHFQPGLECGCLSNQTDRSTIVRPGPGNTYQGRKCFIICLAEVFLQLAHDDMATDIYSDFIECQVVIAATARRGVSGKGQKGKRKAWW